MYMHEHSMAKTLVTIVSSSNGGKGVSSREPNHHTDGENNNHDNDIIHTGRTNNI